MLFGLPFLLGGLVALGQGLRLGLAGQYAQALIPAAMGVVFVGVGGGVMLAGRGAMARAKERADRVSAHPDQPWLWRDEWASGHIANSGDASATGLWIFAVLWNLIAIPAVLTVLQENTASGTPVAWLILVFPLVGLLILGAAIYTTMRRHRFGQSILELVAIPAPLGREIAGRIRVPHAFQADQGVTITLTCARVVVTQSGKNSSTTTTILWQDSQSLPGLVSDGGRASIPFAIAIPADQPQFDDTNSRDKIVWRVTAEASLVGIDYASTFEVPVYRTAETDQPTPADVVARHEAAVAQYRPPADAPFIMTEPPGAVEFYFPMARDLGPALGVTLFTLIWSFVVAFLILAPAPLLFQLAFGGFEIVLLGVMTWVWFNRGRVRAEQSGLTVERGVGPWTGSRRYQPSELESMSARVGMTAGDHAYYDVHITAGDGTDRTIASGFRDRRSAEWFIARLRQAVAPAG